MGYTATIQNIPIPSVIFMPISIGATYFEPAQFAAIVDTLTKSFAQEQPAGFLVDVLFGDVVQRYTDKFKYRLKSDEEALQKAIEVNEDWQTKNKPSLEKLNNFFGRETKFNNWSQNYLSVNEKSSEITYSQDYRDLERAFDERVAKDQTFAAALAVAAKTYFQRYLRKPCETDAEKKEHTSYCRVHEDYIRAQSKLYVREDIILMAENLRRLIKSHPNKTIAFFYPFPSRNVAEEPNIAVLQLYMTPEEWKWIKFPSVSVTSDNVHRDNRGKKEKKEKRDKRGNSSSSDEDDSSESVSIAGSAGTSPLTLTPPDSSTPDANGRSPQVPASELALRVVANQPAELPVDVSSERRHSWNPQNRGGSRIVRDNSLTRSSTFPGIIGNITKAQADVLPLPAQTALNSPPVVILPTALSAPVLVPAAAGPEAAVRNTSNANGVTSIVKPIPPRVPTPGDQKAAANSGSQSQRHTVESTNDRNFLVAKLWATMFSGASNSQAAKDMDVRDIIAISFDAAIISCDAAVAVAKKAKNEGTQDVAGTDAKSKGLQRR